VTKQEHREEIAMLERAYERLGFDQPDQRGKVIAMIHAEEQEHRASIDARRERRNS
jgi:hypothetical protein